MKGRGRFPAKPQMVNGLNFPSKREAQRYGLLRLRERAGLIEQLQVHPAFKVEIRGRHFCRYTADFRYVDLTSGETIIEDVKSSGTRADAAYRLRRRAAELYHNITVHEVTPS